jgi:hypothetical protein
MVVVGDGLKLLQDRSLCRWLEETVYEYKLQRGSSEWLAMVCCVPGSVVDSSNA